MSYRIIIRIGQSEVERNRMRSFIRAIRRLRLKRHDRTAQKTDACHPSHIEAHLCDKIHSKQQQCFPERGWRLLAHIAHTGTTAQMDRTHDTELSEELLERTDFFACLFGSREIE